MKLSVTIQVDNYIFRRDHMLALVGMHLIATTRMPLVVRIATWPTSQCTYEDLKKGAKYAGSRAYMEQTMRMISSRLRSYDREIGQYLNRKSSM